MTVLEKVSDTNLMASVEARSDAEAGIILRFHDPDNYLVALYSPSLKAIFLHDRHDGQWGEPLGRVEVPQIGPKIQMTAAVSGDYAALILTDGQRTFWTPPVRWPTLAVGKRPLALPNRRPAGVRPF